MAEEKNMKTAAITFDRHPQAMFSPTPPPLLCTTQDRVMLLQRYGMEKVYVLPVNTAVMATPWQTFLENLVEEGAAGFVCGDDFRFGANGEGNGEKLQIFCRERGLSSCVIPEQTQDGKRICSTRIRAALERGDPEQARRLMGHPHILSGTVVPGRQIGRKMGVPTANLDIPRGGVCLRFGVYACMAELEGRKIPAVTNVGIRPTVGGQNVTVEPWLLDYEGDLYGKKLTLEFYDYLRPEKKFPSLEALHLQIQEDAAETKQRLK